MKELDEIGKQLPYTESEEYLEQLMARATEEAIARNRHKANVHHMRVWIASAAAVALLLAGIGIAHYSRTNEQPRPVATVVQTETSPIDEFLSTLTDEEAQLLAYYEIEEIPEY